MWYAAKLYIKSIFSFWGVMFLLAIKAHKNPFVEFQHFSGNEFYATSVNCAFVITVILLTIKFASWLFNDSECEKCHKMVHDGLLVLTKKPKKLRLKYATQMSIIRSQLLKIYPDAIETFGFVTKENRNNLNLQKEHYMDACVIASGGK